MYTVAIWEYQKVGVIRAIWNDHREIGDGVIMCRDDLASKYIELNFMYSNNILLFCCAQTHDLIHTLLGGGRKDQDIRRSS